MKREITPTSAAGRGGRSILGMACLMACASGPTGCGTALPAKDTPRPIGQAVIDAKPERARRDRIDGIQLVSVNGAETHGTQAGLPPGRNKVRVRFEWPQGGCQDADLAFYAREGQQYFIQYDPMPPYANRLQEPTSLGDAGTELGRSAAGAGEGFVFLIPPVLALWTAGAVQRGVNEFQEQNKPARYMNIMVISRHPGEGVVRTVRAYPDGRVDASPWAAWAQMSPR